MVLLLDSNVLFRLIYEPVFIVETTRRLLRDPQHRLLVSDATVWEALAKVYRRQVLTSSATLQSELRLIQQLGADFLPILQVDILAAIALPDIHRDPFDRMLIARAQRLSATIVSSDRQLSQYGVPVIPL